MTTNIKAKYTSGALVPLVPFDLEEGREVSVSVEAASAEASHNTPEPKRGLAGIAERVLEMQQYIPPEAWNDLPTDLAKNKKHYLYGYPKETE